MISYVKSSFFAITKKWLNILEKSFKQIGAMVHIYYFYKPKMVLIEVRQRSMESEQVLRIAYITHVGST